jgi:hypothetical protein
MKNQRCRQLPLTVITNNLIGGEVKSGRTLAAEHIHSTSASCATTPLLVLAGLEPATSMTLEVAAALTTRLCCLFYEKPAMPPTASSSHPAALDRTSQWSVSSQSRLGTVAASHSFDVLMYLSVCLTVYLRGRVSSPIRRIMYRIARGRTRTCNRPVGSRSNPASHCRLRGEHRTE